ncbi:MAG: oligosaccharide flippase family protein, partial [Saprospiraceae bacterium]|nr:oligosaccharide flippase family protein [Saprospiraceae bacterium]
MSLIKGLAGETVIYGVSNILSRILQYILLTPYLTYIFNGPNKDQYGIHGLMYAFAALLMVIFTFRMETAFFRFGAKQADRNQAFRSAALPLAIFTLLAMVMVYFSAEQIAGLLTRPEDSRFVQYFAGIIALDTLAALPFAKLRLEKQALRFVVIKVANVLITIFFTLFWLEACPRLIAAGHTGF